VMDVGLAVDLDSYLLFLGKWAFGSQRCKYYIPPIVLKRHFTLFDS